MNRKIIQLLIQPMAMLLVAGCGSGSKDAPIPAPAKAVLSFPGQNAACTSGTVLSATQSSVTFLWTAADNADSYELDVKNLLTGTIITQTTTTSQFTVTLSRNTPYSWYVLSKSNKTASTAQSDVWKFYNAGSGTVSHPPFPADIVTPGLGQNITTSGGTVNLSWTGSDTDGDIAGYDVYLGTTTTPGLLKSAITDMFVNNVTVTSNTTYYWKVVTKDAQGNTSDSGLSWFTVK